MCTGPEKNVETVCGCSVYVMYIVHMIIVLQCHFLVFSFYSFSVHRSGKKCGSCLVFLRAGRVVSTPRNGLLYIYEYIFI